MKVKQFELWIADLNPKIGTETGKIRPVVIIQTDLLNKSHPSTIVCPITTNVQTASDILRVHLTKGTVNVKEDYDIMIDQIRAIDNSRLIHRIGQLDDAVKNKIKQNIKIVLDLD
ncbi:type II toxin-antitoxin system PemK/MazF family toxin [Adhaeribacter pallidiroseus]|uniref:mRNA interferase n=1 Tax=Adhaeribacter pallidiroseus TaxID=2072847 RepID=A0A369QL76_9BACT|nr:type II toxin-antitoxin system PemK/MazF family toxin [Adhaeribacter pallidiroseus]RDC65474.1 Endoribonuclease EndoA [Adhaeribacter pallidiroseus]